MHHQWGIDREGVCWWVGGEEMIDNMMPEEEGQKRYIFNGRDE